MASKEFDVSTEISQGATVAFAGLDRTAHDTTGSIKPLTEQGIETLKHNFRDGIDLLRLYGKRGRRRTHLTTEPITIGNGTFRFYGDVPIQPGNPVSFGIESQYNPFGHESITNVKMSGVNGEDGKAELDPDSVNVNDMPPRSPLPIFVSQLIRLGQTTLPQLTSF